MKTRLIHSLLIIPAGRSHIYRVKSRKSKQCEVQAERQQLHRQDTLCSSPFQRAWRKEGKEREPSGTLLSPTQCHALRTGSRVARKNISGEL